MRLALLLVAAALACKSSAPYTMPAAAINTAIAAGVAGARRASGDCYTPCNPGYACNPASGYCEKLPEICVGEQGADPRCRPAAPGLGARERGEAAPPGLPPGVGISPETGRAPTLPPAKASPENP